MAASPSSAHPPQTMLPTTPKPCCEGCISHLCPCALHHVAMAAPLQWLHLPPLHIHPDHAVMAASPTSAHPPQTMMPWLHLPLLPIHRNHADVAAFPTSAHPPKTVLPWLHLPPLSIRPKHAGMAASPPSAHPHQTMMIWLHLPHLRMRPKPCCNGCIAAMAASHTSAHPPQTSLPWLHLPHLPSHIKPCCRACISHCCPSTQIIMLCLQLPTSAHPPPNHAEMAASPPFAHPPKNMLPWLHHCNCCICHICPFT
jgi:hypothetical protein